MKHQKALSLTLAASIAALYVGLTFFANALGLASGIIQVRFSEALTVLPIFFPAAVPGLSIGCLLANLLTGCALWDIVFGTLATLLGAIGTRLLRRYPFVAILPPILANVLILPFILQYVYGVTDALSYLMLTIGIGELLSCGVLGLVLYGGLKKGAGRLLRV